MERMKPKMQYRVPLPKGKSVEELREWCNDNLNGRVRLAYLKKYNKRKKKWVRDYTQRKMFRFVDDSDAMAFKLKWTVYD